MWSMLVESQRAYTEKFADPAALSASQTTNPLDGLAWQDARHQGGDHFTYKGIKFATRGGVLHWRTAKGRWVPETAVASQPCKRCLDMGVNAEAARHCTTSAPAGPEFTGQGLGNGRQVALESSPEMGSDML